ncbi:MAG: hypothetical protein JWM68_835 [Verrucomicrobiales bacterium]|nr:hypothetical protein [Verrucomicrobiales bacterium]
MKSIAFSIVFACALSLLVGCASSGNAEQKSGWTTLFDGSSTEAFRAYKKESFPNNSWKIENGTLKTIPGKDGVDIITKDEFQDFELSLEWKISPGGNSGVIYRVTEDFDRSWNTGPEMQVLDDTKHNDGKNPKTSAGALYALIPPTNKTLKPVGEWNQARLVIKNNHVEHWLNGSKVVEYQWGSPEVQKLIAESKFKDQPRFARNNSGHIVLQHHHDEVWYRNVKIRRL